MTYLKTSKMILKASTSLLQSIIMELLGQWHGFNGQVRVDSQVMM